MRRSWSVFVVRVRDLDLHCTLLVAVRLMACRDRALTQCVRFVFDRFLQRSIWRVGGHRKGSAIGQRVHVPRLGWEVRSLVRRPFPGTAGQFNEPVSTFCEDSLLPLAFRDNAFHLVESAVRARRAMLDDIAPHLAGATALACFGGSPFDALGRPVTVLQLGRVCGSLRCLGLQSD